MFAGRLRRIAATTALALTITVVASDVPALGLELPASLDVAPAPALGAGPTLTSTPQLPSVPALPLPGPAAPALPTLNPSSQQSAAPAPAGPSGGQAAGSPRSQAVVSTERKGRVSGRGFLRERDVVDRSSVQRGQSAGRSRGQARAASRNSRERRRRSTRPEGPGFGFQSSQFDRLGEVVGSGPSSSQFLGDFSGSPTGDANWAPPLLAIMLLIGLGGFARVGMSASRRRL